MLFLHTPDTCEAFYLGASEPLEDAGSRSVDFEGIRESAQRHGGIEILDPPPFAA